MTGYRVMLLKKPSDGRGKSEAILTQIFPLAHSSDRATLALTEIAGGRNSVATTLHLRRDGAWLELTVEAEDRDPLALLATAPTSGDKADGYLYEEDSLQIATAGPGEAQPSGLCILNPLGNRKCIGAAAAWKFTTRRHGEGWSITVRLSLPADWPTLGLSVLRYYRGVHHEVHGLGHPHPIDTANLAVVLLRETADARQHLALARQAQEVEQARTLAQCRARLEAAQRGNGPKATLQAARDFALARAEQPVKEGTRSLCWNEGHFLHALLDLWDLENDLRWIDLTLGRIEQVWSLRSDRRHIVDKHWGAVLPTWYDADGDWAMPLISGVILGPIARLIRLIHQTPALADLRSRVGPWIDLARQVIDLHEREWVELPDGSGNYLEPYQKGPCRVYPVGGSRLCPLNRVFFLAMPMLDLAAVTGDRAYLEKVRQMALYFKNSCQTTPEGGLVWEYLTSRYPADGEDISHAACQVRFAEKCAADGIVFSERELRMMARTLEAHVFRHGDVPCETIRGYYPTLNMAVAAWSELTRFVPALLPRIVAVTETLMAEGTIDFRQNGWGVVSLTKIEKARRALASGGR